jgi:hypothetical protein
MLLVGVEELIIGEYLVRFARRFEDNGGNVELIEPDVQNRVIELACELERPELGALRGHCVG